MKKCCKECIFLNLDNQATFTHIDNVKVEMNKQGMAYKL